MRSDKLKAVAILTACLLSSSCLAGPQTLRFGVLAGPGSQIAAALKIATQNEALQFDVVTFEDPARLAHELDKGKVDVAELPNAPFLDEQAAKNGYKFSVIGHTVTLPIAIYSRRIDSLRALKAGDTIAIPKTPIDRARALILLHNTGLIKLKDDVGFAATVAHIEDNPRNFRVQETESADLAASLDTAAAAIITFEDAARAKLDPARDALLVEDGRSPYAGILTVKRENRGRHWASDLVTAYHSATMKNFILMQFNGSVRRPW